jgi:hypothetical protein
LADTIVRLGPHLGFHAPVNCFEARRLSLACGLRKIGADLRARHRVQGGHARFQFLAAWLVWKTETEVAQGHSLILHGHLLHLPDAPARMD